MISFWSSTRMHFWNFLYEIIIILHQYRTVHAHCIVPLIMHHGGVTCVPWPTSRLAVNFLCMLHCTMIMNNDNNPRALTNLEVAT